MAFKGLCPPKVLNPPKLKTPFLKKLQKGENTEKIKEKFFGNIL